MMKKRRDKAALTGERGKMNFQAATCEMFGKYFD